MLLQLCVLNIYAAVTMFSPVPAAITEHHIFMGGWPDIISDFWPEKDLFASSSIKSLESKSTKTSCSLSEIDRRTVIRHHPDERIGNESLTPPHWVAM